MATDICELVGRRIRHLRKQKRWTQQILADHAQLTRETVSNAEGARCEIGLRALLRIAEVLEVRLRDLVDP